jgi:hypothetical protein
VKKQPNRNLFLTLGTLITPVAVYIGFISAGAGHGDYVLARWVLPFACASMGDYFGAAFLISVVAFLQWPIYGFLIDKGPSKLTMSSCIAAVHLALCWWLFSKGVAERYQ